MPTTHTITIFSRQTNPPLCYSQSPVIDVGKIIEKEIRDCAMKKQKSAALLFHSLITGICKASGVHFKDSNERIKN